MKTENYEVIFAIVNAGFAEDVMDVASLAVPEPEKKNDFYKKAPERVLFCVFVPAHAPSFASMASQTSSMSPTMP